MHVAIDRMARTLRRLSLADWSVAHGPPPRRFARTYMRCEPHTDQDYMTW